MSDTLNVTHRKGDPCPTDLFIATPPEAFRGARYDRDVEVMDTGGHYPYTVRFSASDDTGDATVYVDIDPAYQDQPITLDGRGACFVNIDVEPGGTVVRVGPQTPLVNLSFAR